MHYLHIVAVEATSAEGAEEAAEAALAGFGDGDVWDWYEIGGRWANYFGEGKGNTLRYTDNPEQYLLTLEDIKKSLDEKALEASRDVLESVDLRRISEGEDQYSDIPPFGTLDMALWRFSAIFGRKYHSSSMFYDAYTHTPGNPASALDRVSVDTGDTQWLVAVDIHN